MADTDKFKGLNYQDRVLLRLQRQYTKDETVKLQKQKIEELTYLLSQSNFNIGELKSEITELEYKLDKLSSHNQKLRKAQSDFDRRLSKRFNSLEYKLKKLRKDLFFWRDKYYSIKNKP